VAMWRVGVSRRATEPVALIGGAAAAA